MKFSGKLVYNKLVANLLIYLVFKFHDIWMSSLRVVIVTKAAAKCLLSGFSKTASKFCLFQPISVGNLSGMFKSEL